MRVLLTGGAGFIGSHTYVALCEAGHQVTILDNFSRSNRDVIARLSTLVGRPVDAIDADVRDKATLDTIFARHAFDAVVHFAAFKSVGESVSSPLSYFENNVGGLVTLMQAMAAHSVRNLVFSSSAAVYGTCEDLPISETAPLQQANPYGHTKLVCEQIIKHTCHADPEWRVGVLRYFNPVGAHASGMIGENPLAVPDNLMPYVAKVAMGELPYVSVFGDDYPTHDGTGVRDYIHVCDLAEGHVLSLQALKRDGAGHTVNLGTGRGHSVLEVIKSYQQASGRDIPYRVAPRREGDAAASYADPRRAKDVLGFSTRFGLADMCASSWNWVTRSSA